MNKKTLISIQIAVWSCIIIFLVSIFVFALYKEFNNEEVATFISGNTIEYNEGVNGIKDIEVKLVSEDVQILRGEGEVLKVIQNASYNLKESDRLVINKSDDNIVIQKSNVNGIFNIFSNFNRRESIIIYLPLGYGESLEVKTISGTINLNEIDLSQVECNSTSGEIELNVVDVENELTLETVSGDIKLDQVTSDKVYMHTTSGEIKARENTTESIDASTTSGDVDFQGIGNSFKMKTTSGKVEIELEQMFEEFVSSSVSGDVRLKIPENDGFKLKYSTTSGDLKTDFDINSGQYKSGISKITITTTSGDMDIERK